MSLRREENASFVRVGIPFANADISDILKNTFSKIPMNTLFRVSSGQGKVREIPDLAKVREKSGNFVEGQGKKWILRKVREKSGNLHLVQSK